MDSKISISRATAAWNRRSGEGVKLKAGEEYTILCDTMWVDQYNTLLADVEYAVKYIKKHKHGFHYKSVLDLLTRIHDKHKEHNESGT